MCCGVVGGGGELLNKNEVLIPKSLLNLFFRFQNARRPLMCPALILFFEHILSLAYVNVARWFPSAFVDHIFNLAELLKNAFAIYLGGGCACAYFFGGLFISFWETYGMFHYFVGAVR